MSDISDIAFAKPALAASSGETLTSRAYASVRRDIIAGQLKPGSKLKIEELRERYYERDAYDFRETSLVTLASKLSDDAAHEDALRILELNVEFHPQSASAHRGVVRHAVEQAINTDGGAGLRAVYPELVNKHVAGAFVWFTLDRVGWNFMNAGEVEEGMAVFNYNVELYPNLASPVNTLAKAHVQIGDTTDRVTDLHLWSIGHGILSAQMTVVSDDPKPAAHYKALVPREFRVVHITVEVHRCEYH